MGTRTAAEIRTARTERERDAALALRRRVFCDEQGVAPELEQDGRDSQATHVVAVRDGVVVGTCRLVFDGPAATLGRMAVELAERGSGLGAAILQEGIEEGRRAGAELITLHAQSQAVPFYARAGFARCGEPFEQAGIEHVRMEIHLVDA